MFIKIISLENTEETKPTGTEDTGTTQTSGEEQVSEPETNPNEEGQSSKGEGSEQGSEDPAPEPAKPVGAYDSLAAEKVSMNAMLFGTLAHQDNYIYSNTKKK